MNPHALWSLRDAALVLASAVAPSDHSDSYPFDDLRQIKEHTTMIEYKTGTDVIDWDSLVQLYSETDGVIGLARKEEHAKIKRAFLQSYRVITAWDGDRIVAQRSRASCRRSSRNVSKRRNHKLSALFVVARSSGQTA